MKVLQFLLPVGLGGVERIAAMLYNYKGQSGNSMYLAIGKSYINDFLQKYSIKNVQNVYPVDDSSMIKSLIGLRRIISQLQPDVVHVHARRETFLAGLVNFNGINIRTQHMAENPGIPVSWIEKYILQRNVVLWVSTSQKLADEYLANLDYIRKRKIRIVYNGIDLPKKTYIHDERQKKFCIISRFTTQKGIDILLNQIAKMPDTLKESIRIDLWGEGEEKGKLLQLIQKLHLRNQIIYKGVTYTPTDELVHYDALLMPSRYEGLPLTMLESMAVKTPVAIHDVGCVSEFLTNNQNGWIIKNPSEWEVFFSKMLADDFDLENIAENAYETYKEKFLGKRMCEAYQDLYAEAWERG